MRYLALSINGQQFNLPGPIENLDNSAGFLGGHIISTTFTLVFVVAFIVTLIFLVIGGYRWIMSQGDPKQVQSARDVIINSFVGLVIILTSFIIVNTIGHFFNVPLLGS